MEVGCEGGREAGLVFPPPKLLLSMQIGVFSDVGVFWLGALGFLTRRAKREETSVTLRIKLLVKTFKAPCSSAKNFGSWEPRPRWSYGELPLESTFVKSTTQ
jgi:hypothetical protein